MVLGLQTGARPAPADAPRPEPDFVGSFKSGSPGANRLRRSRPTLCHDRDGSDRDGRLCRAPPSDRRAQGHPRSDDALARIHEVCRGLPRAVDDLAVQSLVAAFAESKAIVDESSARAITEVTAE